MAASKNDIEELNGESLIEPEPTLSAQQASPTIALGELDSSHFIEGIIPLPAREHRKGNCIILYLPAILEPIQLWNQTPITLGRSDKHLNLYPTVDLSEHSAALLGVSRLHAEISYEDSGYYVRDLDSKNGTWVNQKKLLLNEKIQLANHDTLRLAHFMIQVSLYQN